MALQLAICAVIYIIFYLIKNTNYIFSEDVINKTKEMYENSTVGSISELYDSKKPYLAKGAFAQAWSVSEVFKIILQKG